MVNENIYPVLLAGGSGSRLWPLSRELYPKQLINLVGGQSLIQNTVKRMLSHGSPENIRVVCGTEHYYEIRRHLDEMDIPSQGKVIKEPCGRNTAPAVLLAALEIHAQNPGAIMVVCPADHIITQEDKFADVVNQAVDLANMEKIVTFGINPNYPETGYGYIEGRYNEEAQYHDIVRFVEKPNKQTAQQYVDSGNYYWNSGMFTFKAQTIIDEFERLQPEMTQKLRELLKEKLTKEGYCTLEDISFDYAIMEKTDKGVVIPSSFGWNDIGSWKSLYDVLPRDDQNNVIDGDVIAKDTKNCFIKSNDRLVATMGLNNVVVVETPDTVFVGDMEKSQEIKAIVKELKQTGRPEYKAHTTVYRPWGTYKILEENPSFKIKRIVVYPGKKLSSQMHHHRSEHWTVVSGTAKVTNGDKVFYLKENESTYIPMTNLHRLENPGKVPLHIIEVQMGQYLEEDDIVRFDDDYDRPKQE